MFRSASACQSDLATHRLAAHLDGWSRTASTWFDGTIASVDERIIKLDNVTRFARDTVARIGSTTAGIKCGALLPDLEHTRRELAAARDSLLKGFADRQVSSLAGRRTASSDDDEMDTCDHPGCNRKLDDGEGYDGYCAEHADKREREGKYSSRRTAAGAIGSEDHWSDWQNADAYHREDPREHHDPRHDEDLDLLRQQWRDEGRFASLQRAIVLGSRDFVADQNTTDRDELLLRARRYAAVETSTLPIAMARRISAAFVGQVEELIARRPRKRQASRPITHYEDFDDQLMY